MVNRAAVAIPEKLFFKIGEVCELSGVQAHVLRYWESEFPMLAPQKNRAGQRTYRKRDVEMALRIKQLLYDDQYTIAGAKKKLAAELRGASKLKVVMPEMNASTSAALQPSPAALQRETARLETSTDTSKSEGNRAPASEEQRDTLRRIAGELRQLLALLNEGETSPR
jgi:DNA-binding transcriptional MerR regulator